MTRSPLHTHLHPPPGFLSAPYTSLHRTSFAVCLPSTARLIPVPHLRLLRERALSLAVSIEQNVT